MPRVKRHAKVHASIANHQKTAAVYANNDLLATYVRLLILGVERFADRYGDSFLIHKRELGRITGRHRVDVAAKSLRSLAEVSPISAEPDGDLWRITIPNFARKQGFAEKNGGRMEPSSSSSSSTTTTKKEIEPPAQKPLLNLLSREPGSLEEKTTWLDREYPLLFEMAARDYPDDRKRQSAELRTRVIRHYKQYLKGDGKAHTSDEKTLMNDALRKSQSEVERFKESRRRAEKEALEDE